MKPQNMTPKELLSLMSIGLHSREDMIELAKIAYKKMSAEYATVSHTWKCIKHFRPKWTRKECQQWLIENQDSVREVTVMSSMKPIEELLGDENKPVLEDPPRRGRPRRIGLR